MSIGDSIDTIALPSELQRRCHLVRLLVSVVSIATMVSVLVASTTMVRQSGQAPPPTSASPSDIVLLTGALDLSPQSIAALGISVQAASSLASSIDPTQESLFDLLTKLQSWDSARAMTRLLEEAARSNPSNERVSEYQSAKQREELAKGVYDSSRQTVMAAILNGLSQSEKSQLKSFRDAEKAGLPTAFGAVQMSDAQRKQLRLDINAEKRALRQSENAPSDAASRLSSVRASGAVIAAQERIDSRLTEISGILLSAPGSSPPGQPAP